MHLDASSLMTLLDIQMPESSMDSIGTTDTVGTVDMVRMDSKQHAFEGNMGVGGGEGLGGTREEEDLSWLLDDDSSSATPEQGKHEQVYEQLVSESVVTPTSATASFSSLVNTNTDQDQQEHDESGADQCGFTQQDYQTIIETDLSDLFDQQEQHGAEDNANENDSSEQSYHNMLGKRARGNECLDADMDMDMDMAMMYTQYMQECASVHGNRSQCSLDVDQDPPPQAVPSNNNNNNDSIGHENSESGLVSQQFVQGLPPSPSADISKELREYKHRMNLVAAENKQLRKELAQIKQENRTLHVQVETLNNVIQQQAMQYMQLQERYNNLSAKYASGGGVSSTSSDSSESQHSAESSYHDSTDGLPMPLTQVEPHWITTASHKVAAQISEAISLGRQNPAKVRKIGGTTLLCFLLCFGLFMSPNLLGVGRFGDYDNGFAGEHVAYFSSGSGDDASAAAAQGGSLIGGDAGVARVTDNLNAEPAMAYDSAVHSGGRVLQSLSEPPGFDSTQAPTEAGLVQVYDNKIPFLSRESRYGLVSDSSDPDLRLEYLNTLRRAHELYSSPSDSYIMCGEVLSVLHVENNGCKSLDVNRMGNPSCGEYLVTLVVPSSTLGLNMTANDGSYAELNCAVRSVSQFGIPLLDNEGGRNSLAPSSSSS